MNKIFISEATYPTYLGNTNGYLNKFSLEAQAKFFETTIDLARSKKMSCFIINSMFDCDKLSIHNYKMVPECSLKFNEQEIWNNINIIYKKLISMQNFTY